MGNCKSCGKRDLIGVFLMYNIVHYIMHLVSLFPILNVFAGGSLVKGIFGVVYLNLFFHVLLAIAIVFIESYRSKTYNWTYDY